MHVRNNRGTPSFKYEGWNTMHRSSPLREEVVARQFATDF
jgi:hypothetical protein